MGHTSARHPLSLHSRPTQWGGVGANKLCRSQTKELIQRLKAHGVAEDPEAYFTAGVRYTRLIEAMADPAILEELAEELGKEVLVKHTVVCCPVLDTYCERYAYQRDANGEICIEFCTRKDNTDRCEGNAHKEVCPNVKNSLTKATVSNRYS